MRHSSLVTADLVPWALAGLNLAHYRLLLPLYHDERNAYSPWSAFLPEEPEAAEQLRVLDLYDLRHRAADAGKDMASWDTSRGSVSDDFVRTLGDALGEFVPRDATWTLARWQGYQHELVDTTTVTIGELDHDQQVLDVDDALASIRELGMPDYMWSSTRQFGWGAPLYPDWGVITLAAEDYIRHVAPSNFESFYVPLDAVLPDNLGD